MSFFVVVERREDWVGYACYGSGDYVVGYLVKFEGLTIVAEVVCRVAWTDEEVVDIACSGGDK